MKKALLIINKNACDLARQEEFFQKKYLVKGAASVKEAQEFLREHFSTNGIVVLLGMEFPAQAELDFLSSLRANKHFASSIVIAAIDDTQNANSMNIISFGFDDWCYKSDDLEKINAKIETLLKNKRIFQSGQMTRALKSSILDSAFMAVRVIDAVNFDVLYVNKTALELLCIKNTDYIGKKCYHIFADKDMPCTDCNLYSVYKGSREFEVYVPHIAKTLRQKVAVIEWFGKPAYVDFLEDITEEKKERQLAIERYQKELTRRRRVDLDFMAYLVVDVTKGVVVDHDPHGFPVPILKTGQPMQNFAERVLPTLIDDEERRRFTEMMSPAYLEHAFAMGEDILKIDCRRYARNQKYIMWTRSVIQLIKNPENDDLMLFLYTYDINEQKMLQEIVDSIVKYSYKTIAYINIYDETIKVYAQDGIYRHDDIKPYVNYDLFLENILRNYVPAEDWLTLKEKLQLKNLQSELSGKERHEFIATLIIKGERRAYKFRFINYKNNAYGIIQGMMIDIEDNLQSLKAERDFLQSEVKRLSIEDSTKNIYLASMSHSLKTPLKNIGAALRHLQNNCVHKENQLELMQAKACLTQVMDVIADINAISNLENNSITVREVQFSLSNLVEQLTLKLQKLYSRHKKNFVVEMNIFHDACYGDYKILCKILFNVLDNAFRYAAKSGKIYFTLSEIPSIEHKKCYYRFIIRDCGDGIEPELLPNIFKPFHCTVNTKSKFDSSGLGLAITHMLVKALGGNIEITSEGNEGTAVTIDLSFPSAEGIIEKKEPLSSFSQEDDTLKVLFIKANNLNTLVIRNLLRQKGVMVSECEGFNEAEKILRKGDYHCVIIEIDANTEAVLDFISRNKLRHLGDMPPTIVIGSEITFEQKAAIVNKGVEEVFNKPVKFAELYEKLIKISLYGKN